MGIGMGMAATEDCLFCEALVSDRARIVQENDLAYATRDAYPVTPLHTLIIPKRHVLNYFGLTTAEVSAIHELILAQKAVIDALDSTVGGYNVGMNCGEIAGQSVWHCHVHLIPRRQGDAPHPKGGVRHVIPWKGSH
jgi:diadenosine tetraphosphate (Ap4A) HIT family hydrolase